MFVHHNVRRREIDRKKEFALLENAHGTCVLLVLKNVDVSSKLSGGASSFFCLKTAFLQFGSNLHHD